METVYVFGTLISVDLTAFLLITVVILVVSLLHRIKPVRKRDALTDFPLGHEAKQQNLESPPQMRSDAAELASVTESNTAVEGSEDYGGLLAPETTSEEQQNVAEVYQRTLPDVNQQSIKRSVHRGHLEPHHPIRTSGMWQTGGAPTNAQAVLAPKRRTLKKGQMERLPLRTIPEHLYLYFSALKSIKVNQLQKAEEMLLKVWAVDPDFAPVYNCLGILHRMKGHHKEAIDYFSRCSQLVPHDPVPLYNWALTLQEIGYSDQAVKIYGKALRKRFSLAEAHNNLGVILSEKGLVHDADKEFLEAEKWKPQMYFTYLNHALVREKMADFEGAKELRLRAKKLKPDLFQVRTDGTPGNHAKGDYLATCMHMQVGIPLSLVSTIKTKQRKDRDHTRVTRTLKRPNSVTKPSTTKNDSQENEYASLLMRAAEMIADGKFDIARGLLELAINRNPAFTPCYNELALVLERMDRIEDAKYWLRKAITIDRDNPILHYNLGLLLHRTGDYPLAEESYRAAIAIDHSMPEACLNLSVLLAAKGAYDEAELLLAQVLETRPDWSLAHYERALLELKRGHLNAARTSLQRAFTLDPTLRNITAIDVEALAYSSEHLAPAIHADVASEASKSFSKCVVGQSQPSQTIDIQRQVRDARQLVELTANDATIRTSADPLELLDRVMRQDEVPPADELVRAELLEVTGDWIRRKGKDRIRDICRDKVLKHPEESLYRFVYAQLLIEDHDLVGAATELAVALRLDPKNKKYFCTLAELLLQLNGFLRTKNTLPLDWEFETELLAIGQICDFTPVIEKSKGELEGLTTEDLEESLLQWRLGNDYLARGKEDEALSAYRRSWLQGVRNPRLLSLIALLLVRRFLATRQPVVVSWMFEQEVD